MNMQPTLTRENRLRIMDFASAIECDCDKVNVLMVDLHELFNIQDSESKLRVSLEFNSIAAKLWLIGDMLERMAASAESITELLEQARAQIG